MSLEKAIEHGKEHRRPEQHKHSKNCEFCEKNLKFQRTKKEKAAEQDIEEFEKEEENKD